jgi:glycopeptide antibiotics resistance protein
MAEAADVARAIIPMIGNCKTAAERPTGESAFDARLRLVWLAIGLAFLAFACYGSLVPFNFEPGSLSTAWERLINTHSQIRDGSKVDWGVNVLLLAPAGFCLLAATTTVNTTIKVRVFRTILVAISCLLVSISIELAQSWFPPRVPSLADVAAQFLGVVAGLVGWWVFGDLWNRALIQFWSARRPQSKLDLVLLAYLAGLLLFALAPLDLTLHPRELWRKYQDGRILLLLFSYSHGSVWAFAYSVFVDVILFIPVGVFATTSCTCTPGTPRSLTRSMMLAGAIVLGIELLQLLIMSRYMDSTDLLTGGLGTAIGILGFRYVGGRSQIYKAAVSRRQAWLSIAAVIYATFVLSVFWAPFDFTTSDSDLIRQRMSHFFGVPLSRALEGSYLAAFNGWLQKFVLFFPLGAWIAILVSLHDRALRLVMTMGLLCLAAGFALVLELGQILLPSRIASFDDVIICVTGLLCGLFVVNVLCRPQHES